MHILSRLSWMDAVDRRLLRSEHQRIELTLLTGEATTDWEGAGDIAVVVVRQRTTGIDQQQVSLLKHVAVVDVVQNASVVSSRNDGAVGGTSGSLLEEVLLNQSLHLTLRHARANGGSGQFMG